MEQRATLTPVRFDMSFCDYCRAHPNIAGLLQGSTTEKSHGVSKYHTGEMLSNDDVENVLTAFMIFIIGFMMLALILIVVVRIHYKAKGDELIHDLEIQHQAKKTKNPSPFAVQLQKPQLSGEEYVAAAKVRDGSQCLYWRGDQIAAILHHAALVPIMPPLETPEKNVHISNVNCSTFINQVLWS